MKDIQETTWSEDEIATLNEIKRAHRGQTHLWLDDSGWPRRLVLFLDDACATEVAVWYDETGNIVENLDDAGHIDSRASDDAPDADALTGHGRC